METLQISIFFPCDFPGFFFLTSFPSLLSSKFLHLSPLSLRSKPLSVSPQQRVGLPGILTKHGITGYCLTTHVKTEQYNPFGGKVPTSKQESQRHPTPSVRNLTGILSHSAITYRQRTQVSFLIKIEAYHNNNVAYHTT